MEEKGPWNFYLCNRVKGYQINIKVFYNFLSDHAERLKFVSNLEDADYFISLSNFRSQKEHRDFVTAEFPYDRPEIISIRVKNYRLISIYKLN